VERDVLITKIDETVELPDHTVLKLGANGYRDGTNDPQGFTYLEMVSLLRGLHMINLSGRIVIHFGVNGLQIADCLARNRCHLVYPRTEGHKGSLSIVSMRVENCSFNSRSVSPGCPNTRAVHKHDKYPGNSLENTKESLSHGNTP
jgi:hypothetical protein